MSKMKITFNGFEDLLVAINKAGGDIQQAADEALKETSGIISGNTRQAAAPYAHGGRKGYATGKMYGTIIDGSAVSWAGMVATIDAGFNLRAPGGYHSIFIMYGTPRMTPDRAVYNAIRGASTKRQIKEVQDKTLNKYLRLSGGGGNG